MIARRPSGGDVRGATPAHPLLFPVGHQDASLSQSPQQQLLDQRYIQRMFADGALGGLWLPEPQYLYEDSAGTTSASINGVVGAWGDVVTALQATTANKPYLRKTSISGKYWLDGNTATAAMMATFPSSLGSACTVARANADGVTITPAQTITTTYKLTPPYGYNSAVMIINRALTASETAVVSRYLRNWVPVLGAELITNGNFDTGIGGWTAFNTTLSYENSGLTMTRTGDNSASFSPNFYCGDSHCFVKATFTYDAADGNNFISVKDSVGSASKMSVNMGSTLGTYTGVTTKLLPTGAYFVFSFSTLALIGNAASIDSVSARSIL